MNLAPMRFNGVQWHHNPREITFECDSEVSELKALYGTSYIQNLGRRNMKISGEGELYGEDCTEQFERIFELFKRGGAGVLAIPGLTPVYAVFETLKIVGEPKPDVLTYSFVFREKMESRAFDIPTAHTVTEGESLWDISYYYDIPIDLLVRLNPWIKRPDELEQGSTVILC